jgi:hypothetical protein
VNVPEAARGPACWMVKSDKPIGLVPNNAASSACPLSVLVTLKGAAYASRGAMTATVNKTTATIAARVILIVSPFLALIGM